MKWKEKIKIKSTVNDLDIDEEVIHRLEQMWLEQDITVSRRNKSKLYGTIDSYI